MILSYLIVDILCILMIDGLVYELVNDGKDHCFDEKVRQIGELLYAMFLPQSSINMTVSNSKRK